MAVGPLGNDGISYASDFVDLDGDLDEDLLVAYGVTGGTVEGAVPDAQPDRLYRNVGNTGFVDISTAAGFTSEGWGRGLATGDLDGNGVTDVVLSERVGVKVYQGEGGCPGPRLRFDAGPGNHEGIGTRVHLVTRKAEATRWVLPANTLGQAGPELILGLNGSPSAELTISWPDGSEDRVSVGATERRILTPD